MSKNYIKRLVISAMLLAVGMILPLLTGQIKEIGDSLLPMHLPVLLCGIICGWKYGLGVGAILPFFRSVTFGMPPIYPQAVWMAAELAAYGFIIGFVYSLIKTKELPRVYISLISALLGGRVVWGVVKAILLGAGGKSFTFALFITGGFIDAWPGIVIQLVLVPTLVFVYNRFIKRGIGL
jgi:hypothetical protein